MPQRDIDNYGYHDGDKEKRDFRSGLDNRESKEAIGKLSSKYVGTSLEVSNPIKLTETSFKLSIGEIIDDKDSATKVCGEISFGISTPEPEMSKEIAKMKETLSKILDTANKVDIKTTDEKAVDSASLEIKISAEANTLPTTKSVEGSVKFSTNEKPKLDWEPDYDVGDKMGIGGKVSVEGCMTIKNRDTNSWDLINKW